MEPRQERNPDPDVVLNESTTIGKIPSASADLSAEMIANKAHNDECLKLAVDTFVKSPLSRATVAEFLSAARKAGIEMNVNAELIEATALQVAESILSFHSVPITYESSSEYGRNCRCLKALIDAGLATECVTPKLVKTIDNQVSSLDKNRKWSSEKPRSFLTKIDFTSGSTEGIFQTIISLDCNIHGGGERNAVFEAVNRIRELKLPVAQDQKELLVLMERFHRESKDDHGWGRSNHEVLLSLIRSGYFQDLHESQQEAFKEKVIKELNSPVTERSSEARQKGMNFRAQCAEIVALFAEMKLLDREDYPKVREAFRAVVEGFEGDKYRLGEFWNSRIFKTLIATNLIGEEQIQEAIDPLVTIQRYGSKYVTREAAYEALALIPTLGQMKQVPPEDKFRTLRTLLSWATEEYTADHMRHGFIREALIKGAENGFFFLPG